MRCDAVRAEGPDNCRGHKRPAGLVHASLAKEPSARPDVLALLRHPLIQRHQSNAELQRYLTAALQAGMAGGSPDVTRASPEQTPTRPR